VVSKKQAEDVSGQVSEWMRVGFMQFLSSESPALMGIDDLGSFKFHTVEKFREILHAVTKSG
jgi:hypothetical protein